MRTVHHSDVMTYIQNYQGEQYHALFCDPPYHLTSIAKRFGSPDAAPAKPMKSGDKAYSRLSRGFMGKQWDGGELAFTPELWQGLGTLLHPGAFGMAFASTRGYHRMACAIEDAGMIIHPMLVWVFSSGFPKATRVKDAPAFSGHRYGGQALAPSLEPVVVFQKPYAGKPRDCIVATGAGALNIEAARIDNGARPAREAIAIGYGAQGHSRAIGETDSGRWAKNFILSHSPGCTMFECSPDCPVQRMDMQTGELNVAPPGKPSRGKSNNTDGIKFIESNPAFIHYDDSGTGSRFFFNADYLLNRMEDTDPFIYAAKAGTTEREAGLTGFARIKVNDGRETEIDNPYQRGETQRKNTHPTVKPLALAQHFASLLLPPVEYAPRRLLVPFAGSASEMIGALLAGWEYIDGIEMEADYVKIARARLDYWKAHQPNMAGKKKPKAAIKKVSALQMALL